MDDEMSECPPMSNGGDTEGLVDVSTAQPEEQEQIDSFVRTVLDVDAPQERVLTIGHAGEIVDARLKAIADTHPPQISQGLMFDENEAIQAWKIRGRIGPTKAVWNEEGSRDVLIERDGRRVEGHNNFGSVRANVCVFRGRWMYEVILETAGVQQIGWATYDCPFTSEEGIGDAPDSFAFDGKRVKKWNGQHLPYGQPWVVGDVIGCCLDLESREISFLRNGKSMGVAFTNIRMGPGIAYFPGISVSSGERCEANFGQRPLRYPMEGFQPIQDRPTDLVLETAHYLRRCLIRLLPRIIEIDWTSGQTHPNVEDCTILAVAIFHHLGPLITDEYIMEHEMLPILVDMHDNVICHFVRLWRLLLEPFELKKLVSTLFSILALKSRTAGYTASCPTAAFPYLSLACALLKDRTLLGVWVSCDSFSADLEGFLTVKHPSVRDLATLLPVVWWPSLVVEREEEVTGMKEEMERTYSLLADAFAANEALQRRILEIFLNDDTPLPVCEASPRIIILDWLRYLITKNRGMNRNVRPPGLSDHSTLASLYFALLHYLQRTLAFPSTLEFPFELFFSRFHELHYFDLPRLGGTLSHLQKNFPVPPDDGERRTHVPTEPLLLDTLVFFYHLAMGTIFKKTLIEVQNRLHAISQYTETLPHVTPAAKADVMDHIRLGVWHRVTLFAEWKRVTMFSSCCYLLDLLTTLSQSNPHFSYVPEFYIETMMDSFHTLRRGDPTFLFVGSPTADNSRARGFNNMITFMVDHFHDPRLINADLRELLLQSISVFLQYRDYVRMFEENPKAGMFMIPEMLHNFNSRFWIQITTILLRFWRGRCFAHGSSSSEVSSVFFQRRFREACEADPGLLATFVNQAFNNLTYTLTEFVVSMKDIQERRGNLSLQALNEVQQMQRKCNIMYELTTNLLRLLECVTIEQPQFFIGEAGDIQASRLCETILYVLKYGTCGGHAKLLDSTISSHFPMLRKISRTSLLGPVVGMCLNLHAAGGDKATNSNALVVALTSHEAFVPEYFDYLQSYAWAGGASEDDPSLGRLVELNAFLADVRACHVVSLHDTEETDDRDLCTICYSFPLDTAFLPCGHRSCWRCIARHLLNNERCFFCNAAVVSAQRDDGTILKPRSKQT